MRVLALVLLFLAACGRPLAPDEAALAGGLFSGTLDTERVRLVSSPVVGLVERRYAARPRVTCRERILPPEDAPFFTARAAGVVLWNHVHIRADLFRANFARDREGRLTLAAAMFLAHELTHVWQWQNRALTGYSPLRGGLEHLPGGDPYLFDPEMPHRFLDFGYEQQASLVEEYLCCRALDPEGGRTARLHALLAEVMPPPMLSLPDEVVLPWPEAPVRGICS